MFSEKAKKTSESCRFCWMCRHTCPVGLVTGKEGNNARAKGLLVSMDDRNEPLNPDSMSLMYECSLCKACTYDCASGLDPSVYILEARTTAVVEEMLPERVKVTMERALSGSIYGMEPDPALLQKIRSLPKKAEIIVYLGANAREVNPAIATAFLDLLDAAKVDYTAFAEEPECGAMLYDLIGNVHEVRDKAEKCDEAIKNAFARELVVLDPSDCAFMKHACRAWGLFNEVEIITATSFADGLIRNNRFNLVKTIRKAAFHDPCRLARDLDEIDASRHILASIGVEVSELISNKKKTKCCGGPLLKENFPELAQKTAEARWSDVAFGKQALLVTACPCCYDLLRCKKPEEMIVEDIFVLLKGAVQ